MRDKIDDRIVREIISGLTGIEASAEDVKAINRALDFLDTLLEKSGEDD